MVQCTQLGRLDVLRSTAATPTGNLFVDECMLTFSAVVRFETFSWKAVASRAFGAANDDMQLQEHIGCCTYGKDGPSNIENGSFLERILESFTNFIGSIGEGVSGLFESGSSDSSQSRFGPNSTSAASAKIRSAVLLGLHQKFPTITNAEDPTQAMLTHAKPLVDAGMAPATATAAMINGIHHYVAQHVETIPHVTEELLENESVSEIHDAYLRGGVSGSPMDVHIDRVVASGDGLLENLVKLAKDGQAALKAGLKGLATQAGYDEQELKKLQAKLSLFQNDDSANLKDLETYKKVMKTFRKNFAAVRDAMEDPTKTVDLIVDLIGQLLDHFMEQYFEKNELSAIGEIVKFVLEVVIEEFKRKVVKIVKETFHLSSTEAEKFGDAMAHKINSTSSNTTGIVSVKHKMTNAEADRVIQLDMSKEKRGGDKHTNWEDGVYDILCFRPFRQYVMVNALSSV